MKAHWYWFKLVSLWLLAASATGGVPPKPKPKPKPKPRPRTIPRGR